VNTVGQDLDLIQARLHDGGTVWTRAELLNWYNDGYYQLCWQSGAIRRLQFYDLPPRFAYTHTFEWETQFTQHGPSRCIGWSFHDRTYRCTSYWEVSLITGHVPAASLPGITQDWERSHVDAVDQHYTFALPHNFDLLLDARWNNRPLNGISVREMDEADDAWMRRVGEPWWYSTGTGRNDTVEIFQIKTDYQQAYSAIGYDSYGFPRLLSGDRTYEVSSSVRQADYTYTASGDVPNPLNGFGWRFTYPSTVTSKMCVHQWEQQWLDGLTMTDSPTSGRGTQGWESQHGIAVTEFGVGFMRGLTSPDRQYLGYGQGLELYDYYGGVRSFSSSDNALEILVAQVPTTTLAEDDYPLLLPEQTQKYLRHFVWSRAFGRQGPAMIPKLSAHYRTRFIGGVMFMKELTNAAAADSVKVKDSAAGNGSSRPPYVRLPANFESTW